MNWIKSSYCGNSYSCVEVAWRKADASTYNGNCVEVGWQKGSGSHPNGSCVEVGEGACGMVHVRDSKAPDGPMLSFTTDEWCAFLAGAKAGEFDVF